MTGFEVAQTTTFHLPAGGELGGCFAAARAAARAQGLRLSDCYLHFNDVLLPLDETDPEKRYDMQCNWRGRVASTNESWNQ